uniref:Uncharacterized protein n=1 Tax=Nelumbo nucifera TaxID=4432 RepID=A0A822Y9X1_NELNU|nr:TPA_asm: hypothetical protein HUJ06_027846 [Nelumbo nucifera]
MFYHIFLSFRLQFCVLDKNPELEKLKIIENSEVFAYFSVIFFENLKALFCSCL